MIPMPNITPDYEAHLRSRLAFQVNRVLAESTPHFIDRLHNHEHSEPAADDPDGKKHAGIREKHRAQLRRHLHTTLRTISDHLRLLGEDAEGVALGESDEATTVKGARAVLKHRAGHLAKHGRPN